MRDEYAGALSGGQRKLLEMARALMTNPRLVMLDEPMAGVNPALKQSLNDHIRGLRDEGMTVLFVEHDMDMVHDISDWVVVMAEGRVIAEGTPDQISSNTGGDRRLPRHAPGQVVAGGSRHEATSRASADGPRGDRSWSPGTSPRSTSSTAATWSSNQGEFVGIIGPNGAGKSTLLKAVLGLCTVRSGTVTLDGERHHRQAGPRAGRRSASATCRRTRTCSPA